MSFIAMASIILLVALNGYEIFTRFLLQKSNYWIQDVTTLLMVWFVFPGMVKIVWEKNDILIDLLTKALPPEGRKALSIFVHVAVILFTGAMSYATGRYLHIVWNAKSITAHIPMPLFTSMILLGFLMFMCIYIYDFIDLLKNKDEAGNLGGRNV